MAQTIDHNGRTYSVEIEHDDSANAPWDMEDGHGPVSEWTRRAKAPSERVLHSDRGSHRYYDFAAAVRIARRDWIGPGPGAGKRAAEAAEADYERLRAWCNDQWSYVGVVVRPVCACCGEPSRRMCESLWGIESDAGNYLDEVARELAEQCEAVTEPCCVAAEG